MWTNHCKWISKWKEPAYIKRATFCLTVYAGADPGFQVRGGALKKNAPSGGRRENFGDISCEKSRFYPKKSYFFQLRREVRNFWGISCEKSRFYPKKSYFFQLRREVRNFWGISCEKSRFYAKNHIFSNFRGGRAPWIRPYQSPYTRAPICSRPLG